jgi:V8-like Glu-specific endopeptidase
MFKVLMTASAVAMSVAVTAHASPINVRGGGLFEARQVITTTLDNDNALYVPSAADKNGTVRIRIVTTGDNYTCSGSVIGRNAVLTAAHCVNIPGATVQQVQVWFGGGSAASGIGDTGRGLCTGPSCHLDRDQPPLL